MKKQIVYFSLLLLQLVTYSVSAQNKGDIIKGKVSEIGGPMVMVSVYERDSINNIVSLGVTDYQGLFSFTLVDPNDIIWVTYPGYDTVVFPIDKLYYEIQLKEKSNLPKVYIVDGPERLTPSRDPSYETTAFAQDKPKAGDTISGIVCDQEGPMMQVYVTERDSTNHVVTYCSTTMDGKFSFVLVNPNDSLKASYVGYVPVVVPIDRTYIEIKMKEQPGLSPIDITGHGQIKPLELKPGTVISGRVLDAATNEPLGPYASIIETVDNDTAAYYYTLTDKDGFFSYPLVGTGHVIKVDFTGYKSVKFPLDKNYFEIKLEKAPPGYKKDGVLYQFGVFHMGDAKSFDEEMKQMIGPNIRVVKPEELIDDGEGIFIEEIE